MPYNSMRLQNQENYRLVAENVKLEFRRLWISTHIVAHRLSWILKEKSPCQYG